MSHTLNDTNGLAEYIADAVLDLINPTPATVVSTVLHLVHDAAEETAAWGAIDAESFEALANAVSDLLHSADSRV